MPWGVLRSPPGAAAHRAAIRLEVEDPWKAAQQRGSPITHEGAEPETERPVLPAVDPKSRPSLVPFGCSADSS
jgi:hypothetical protein